MEHIEKKRLVNADLKKKIASFQSKEIQTRVEEMAQECDHLSQAQVLDRLDLGQSCRGKWLWIRSRGQPWEKMFFLGFDPRLNMRMHPCNDEKEVRVIDPDTVKIETRAERNLRLVSEQGKRIAGSLGAIRRQAEGLNAQARRYVEGAQSAARWSKRLGTRCEELLIQADDLFKEAKELIRRAAREYEEVEKYQYRVSDVEAEIKKDKDVGRSRKVFETAGIKVEPFPYPPPDDEKKKK